MYTEPYQWWSALHFLSICFTGLLPAWDFIALKAPVLPCNWCSLEHSFFYAWFPWMAEAVLLPTSTSSRNNNQASLNQLNLSGSRNFHTKSIQELVITFSIAVLKPTVDSFCITKKPSPYVKILVDGKVIFKAKAVKKHSWTNLG